MSLSPWLGLRGLALPSALLAAALVIAPASGSSRLRLGRLGTAVGELGPDPDRRRSLAAAAGAGVGLAIAVVVGGVSGVVVGCVSGPLVALGARRILTAAERVAVDPLQLAGAWDLLAACLRAGAPVATAVTAISDQLPARLSAELRRISHLLALGADPAAAWTSVTADELTALARAASRSATSGAALAELAASAAAECRSAAADAAEVRAQRAGVLITGPLGLCFLPAFICLGVIPVVIGLAGGLLARW